MKRLLSIVSSVVVLSMITLAVILIPAHVQVRGVAPVLPSQNEMLALRGVNGPTKVAYILTSSQQLERGKISHISIVIEWANGQRFLIDAGMSEQEADSFAELLQKMDATAGQATIYGTVAQLLGPNIKDLAGVGFSHLHIDHTQGIQNFCEQRGKGAVLLQTPNQKDLHNFNTTEGAGLIASSCLTKAEFTPANNGNFYRSCQFPGLAAIELGGHTPGSTLWAVALGDKVLLFSGDITNDKTSIDHDTPKPALYSYLFVPEDTKRTAELRQWLRELDQSEPFSVIVSHDLSNTQAHLSEFNQ
jgi:glyoxylase-like metal-dependent hydrolase (beta-lactamase superfamily II)